MTTLAEASLSAAERRVLDKFVELLKAELGDELDSVWLYGSRARGEAPHEESDIDLIVLTANGDADHGRVIDAAFEAREGVLDIGWLSVHTQDRAWLEGRRAIESFFIQEVDRDKIVLYGKP
jgi:predicted nucleotidyltransferase